MTHSHQCHIPLSAEDGPLRLSKNGQPRVRHTVDKPLPPELPPAKVSLVASDQASTPSIKVVGCCNACQYFDMPVKTNTANYLALLLMTDILRVTEAYDIRTRCVPLPTLNMPSLLVSGDVRG